MSRLLAFTVLVAGFSYAATNELPAIVNRSVLPIRVIREVLEQDSSVGRDDAIMALQDSLIARGFFGATVDISGETLYVVAGNRYETAGVRWLGDSLVIDPMAFARVPLQTGREFEFWQVSESANGLLDWCEESGFPFARVEVDSFELDHISGHVTPHLRIAAGPRIAISFVNFEGNTISQNSLLLRESRLRIGSLYRESRIGMAKRRLSQLEYLRRVSDPKLVVDDQGRSGLVIPVEESKLSRLDAVAGLAPAAEGESQTVTGLVDLQLLNLFGSGRRAKVFWRRPSSKVQEIALAWREVWVAGTPFWADMSFAQRVEDTLYVTRRFGGKVGYPISASLEVFGGVAREELLADSTTARQLGLTTSATTLWESGFAVDTRNHRSNPRSGVKFETSIANGVRRTDVPPQGSDKRRFTQRRVSTDVEFNKEVRPYWIAHVSGHGRAVSSDEPQVPTPDLVRVGGARTLRGYREEQFLGSQVAWGTLEARYWLGNLSRVAIFGDFGAISREMRREESKASVTTLKAAYGFGLRMETGLGVWGIDYGIAGGTSPLNGQLHVSLLSLF